MGIKFIRDIPSYEELSLEYPLPGTTKQDIAKHRQEIYDILSGIDNRKLIILGPCSAWPKISVIEYAKHIKILQQQLQNKYKLVMRVYTQKSRTFGGWSGSLIQPDPRDACDIAAGLRYCRKLMVDVASLGVAIADELLYTHANSAISELLSWGAIGARSSEDPEHRVFASTLDFAVGFKNPTSGDLSIGLNAVGSAQISHNAIFNGQEIISTGNPYAHIVLRGGNTGVNYKKEHLLYAIDKMQEYKLQNPAILVDTSHGNSIINGVKSYRNQITVVEYLVDLFRQNDLINYNVKGIMLESFMLEGSQPINGSNALVNGLSITDPCISLEQTIELLNSL